jgi:hypothetical protein
MTNATALPLSYEDFMTCEDPKMATLQFYQEIGSDPDNVMELLVDNHIDGRGLLVHFQRGGQQYVTAIHSLETAKGSGVHNCPFLVVL